MNRRGWLAATAVAAAWLATPARAAEHGPARWTARWIAPQGEDPAAFGVYLLRRTFTVAAAPATFRVHVTADNRYQLFVNGQRVSWGPARSDVAH